MRLDNQLEYAKVPTLFGGTRFPSCLTCEKYPVMLSSPFGVSVELVSTHLGEQKGVVTHKFGVLARCQCKVMRWRGTNLSLVGCK